MPPPRPLAAGLTEVVDPRCEQSHGKYICQPNEMCAGVIFDVYFWREKSRRLRDRKLNRFLLTTLCKIISLASLRTGERSTLSKDSWGQRKSSWLHVVLVPPVCIYYNHLSNILIES